MLSCCGKWGCEGTPTFPCLSASLSYLSSSPRSAHAPASCCGMNDDLTCLRNLPFIRFITHMHTYATHVCTQTHHVCTHHTHVHTCTHSQAHIHGHALTQKHTHSGLTFPCATQSLSSAHQAGLLHPIIGFCSLGPA